MFNGLCPTGGKGKQYRMELGFMHMLDDTDILCQSLKAFW